MKSNTIRNTMLLMLILSIVAGPVTTGLAQPDSSDNLSVAYHGNWLLSVGIRWLPEEVP